MDTMLAVSQWLLEWEFQRMYKLVKGISYSLELSFADSTLPTPNMEW